MKNDELLFCESRGTNPLEFEVSSVLDLLHKLQFERQRRLRLGAAEVGLTLIASGRCFLLVLLMHPDVCDSKCGFLATWSLRRLRLLIYYLFGLQAHPPSKLQSRRVLSRKHPDTNQRRSTWTVILGLFSLEERRTSFSRLAGASNGLEVSESSLHLWNPNNVQIPTQSDFKAAADASSVCVFVWEFICVLCRLITPPCRSTFSC